MIYYFLNIIVYVLGKAETRWINSDTLISTNFPIMILFFQSNRTTTVETRHFLSGYTVFFQSHCIPCLTDCTHYPCFQQGENRIGVVLGDWKANKAASMSSLTHCTRIRQL